MKRCLMLLFALLLSGCAASSAYKLSPDAYKKQVRTLGVLPVVIDSASIDYQAHDALVAELARVTAPVQQKLVERLRNQGGYFDVRAVVGDADDLRSRLIVASARVGEGAATHLLYRFNPQGAAQLADEAVADAVLVVILNGITRPEKRWSSHSLRMEYLEADYSSILYTAAVVDPSGRVLWQLDTPQDEALLRLDYPDFAEAYWNRTEAVRVKPISLEGLTRTLREADAGLLVDKELPKPISRMVSAIATELK